jgi:hypothetical protein
MTHRYPFDDVEYQRENRELSEREERDEGQRLDEEWKLRSSGESENE